MTLTSAFGRRPSSQTPLPAALAIILLITMLPAMHGTPASAADSDKFSCPTDRVHDIRDHGAIGDGLIRFLEDPEADNRLIDTRFPDREAYGRLLFAAATDTTDWRGILLAIIAANRCGGGKVVVPAGNWLTTSPVPLLGNVHLEGDGRATVLRNVNDGTLGQTSYDTILRRAAFVAGNTHPVMLRSDRIEPTNQLRVIGAGTAADIGSTKRIEIDPTPSIESEDALPAQGTMVLIQSEESLAKWTAIEPRISVFARIRRSGSTERGRFWLELDRSTERLKGADAFRVHALNTGFDRYTGAAWIVEENVKISDLHVEADVLLLRSGAMGMALQDISFEGRSAIRSNLMVDLSLEGLKLSITERALEFKGFCEAIRVRDVAIDVRPAPAEAETDVPIISAGEVCSDIAIYQLDVKDDNTAGPGRRVINTSVDRFRLRRATIRTASAAGLFDVRTHYGSRTWLSDVTVLASAPLAYALRVYQAKGATGPPVVALAGLRICAPASAGQRLLRATDRSWIDLRARGAFRQGCRPGPKTSNNLTVSRQ